MTEAQANAQGYFLHLGSEGGVCGRPLRWFVLNREGITLSPGFPTQAAALLWLRNAQEERDNWRGPTEKDDVTGSDGDGRPFGGPSHYDLKGQAKP